MMKYQTRGKGEVNHFATFKEAYDYAMTHSVWKISFDDEDGQDHRWIKYSRAENDANLINQCEKYKNCTNPKQLFWVDQPMSLYLNEVEETSIKMTELKMKRDPEYDEMEMKLKRLKAGESPILQCLTDEEFRQKYM